MKLKPFDRFTNTVLILCIIAFCGLCCGIAWGLLEPRVFTWFANALTNGILASIITTVVALLIIFVCIRILFIRQREKHVESAPRTPGVLVRKGESGAVFLALPALEEIVLRNVRMNTKVRDARCELLPTEAGVSMRIIANLAPDANIPEVSAEIQDTVKTNVEATCGINVLEVQFVVERAETNVNLAPSDSKVRVQ